MKKATLRQKNYRLRRSIKTTAGTLRELLSKYPPETSIQEIYKQLFEELIVLENNKGATNVRKK